MRYGLIGLAGAMVLASTMATAGCSSSDEGTEGTGASSAGSAAGVAGAPTNRRTKSIPAAAGKLVMHSRDPRPSAVNMSRLGCCLAPVGERDKVTEAPGIGGP